MSSGFSFFTPSAGDLSLTYLSQIFGSMNGLLPGAKFQGPSLFGMMFTTFNSIILAIAALMVLYVTIVGVMMTAHEGEFMGKKWNNIWIPIRSVLGIAALVPMPVVGGYSALQVVMMWVIVLGVGAADNVWNTVLGYKSLLGSPYSQQSLPTTATEDQMNKLFSGLVCDATARISTNPYGTDKLPKAGSYYCLVNNNSFCSSSFQFPPANPNCSGGQCTFSLGPNGTCGVLTYCDPATACQADPSSLKCQECQAQSSSLSAGVGQLYLVAQLFAYTDYNYRDFFNNSSSGTSNPKWQFVYDYCAAQPQPVSQADCYTNSAAITAKVSGGSSSASMGSMPQKNSGFPSPNYKQAYAQNPSDTAVTSIYWPYAIKPHVGTSCTNSTASCSGLPSSGVSGSPSAGGAASASPSGQTCSFIDNAVSAYMGPMTCIYNQYAYNQAQTIGSNPNALAASGGVMGLVLGSAQNTGWILAGAYYYYIANSVGGSLSDAFPVFSVSGMDSGGEMSKYRNNFTASSTLLDATLETEGATGGIASTAPQLKGMGGMLAKAVKGMTSVFYHTLTATGGPLYGLALLGNIYITLATFLFLWIASFSFNLGLAAGSVDIYVLGNGIIDPVSPALFMAYFFLAPLILGFLGILFTVGAMLAVYVPLIPYILFTFGAIGWLIAVIETMVAGPLVALGIISPSGAHEIMGKAEPALMLLFNVFLRPTLMIFGLIAAMLLANIVITMIMSAFLIVLFGAGNLNIINPIIMVLFIWAFAAIIIIALNKAFSAIHIIPTRVFSWISGHGMEFGEERALGEGKEALGAQASKGAGGMKEAGRAGEQAGKETAGVQDLKKKRGGLHAGPDEGGGEG